jgi:hypothetical protein
MKSFVSSGLKITCGITLGYALLFLYVSIFQVALWPLAQIILGE